MHQFCQNVKVKYLISPYIFFSVIFFLHNVNNHISHVTSLRCIVSVMKEISSFQCDRGRYIYIMFQKETVILYYNTLIYYTVWRFIYFHGYNILAYFGLVNTSAKKKPRQYKYVTYCLQENFYQYLENTKHWIFT